MTGSSAVGHGRFAIRETYMGAAAPMTRLQRLNLQKQHQGLSSSVCGIPSTRTIVRPGIIASACRAAKPSLADLAGVQPSDSKSRSIAMKR